MCVICVILSRAHSTNGLRLEFVQRRRTSSNAISVNSVVRRIEESCIYRYEWFAIGNCLESTEDSLNYGAGWMSVAKMNAHCNRFNEEKVFSVLLGSTLIKSPESGCWYIIFTCVKQLEEETTSQWHPNWMQLMEMCVACKQCFECFNVVWQSARITKYT